MTAPASAGVEESLAAADSERNAGIDALRGLAILFVILHHLALPFRLPLRDGWLADWLPARVIGALSHSGYLAVYVFFVLSGFLIARRAIDRYGSLNRIDWRAFYRQRFARIAPLLLLLLAILSFLHLLAVPGFVIEREHQSLAGALMAAVFLHVNWYEGRTGWLPASWDVLWSLSIEEVFYLAFPIACLTLRGRWLVSALLVLALSLPITRAWYDGNDIWQEKAYLPGMSAIAAGVLAALLVQAWHYGAGFARALLICGIAVFAMSMLAGGEMWRALRHHSMLLIVAGAVLLVLALHRLRHPLAPAWLQRMGRLSYELYLTHMFVVLLVTGIWHRQSWDRYWGCLAYPLVVAACVALAAIVERWVSRPARNYVLRGG